MQILLNVLIRFRDTGKTEMLTFDLLNPDDMFDYISYLEYDEIIDIRIHELPKGIM